MSSFYYERSTFSQNALTSSHLQLLIKQNTFPETGVINQIEHYGSPLLAQDIGLLGIQLGN